MFKITKILYTNNICRNRCAMKKRTKNAKRKKFLRKQFFFCRSYFLGVLYTAYTVFQWEQEYFQLHFFLLYIFASVRLSDIDEMLFILLPITIFTYSTIRKGEGVGTSGVKKVYGVVIYRQLYLYTKQTKNSC